jgi:hypothetical protein
MKVVTAAQHAAAEPVFAQFMAMKLDRIGAKAAAGRFKHDGPLRKRQSRKWFNKYVADGGDPGDLQSFFAWLVAHADEIIALISKLILLFAK